jgi:hypothetical protein
MIGLEGLLVYVAVSTSNLVASNLAISLVHGISSIVKEFKEDAGVDKVTLLLFYLLLSLA